MKIDLVLPLKVDGSYGCNDLLRTKILLHSLSVFAQPETLGQLFIVADEGEIPQIQGALKSFSSLPLAFVSEQELVPAFAHYPSLRGWRKQQIIKLAAATIVSQPFYLTLDADVICLRPFNYNDLVVDGRALIQYELRSQHPKWWRSSARLLELPVDDVNDGRGMSVTPAILSRDIVTLLQQDLANGTVSWVDRLCHLHRPWHVSNWTLARLRRAKWTEYSLYYLCAMKHACLDDHHIECQTSEVPQYLLNHDAHPFELWDASATFSPQGQGLFCVVGSKSMVPPQVVWERVAPFIVDGEAITL